jgi:hypothetical protein
MFQRPTELASQTVTEQHRKNSPKSCKVEVENVMQALKKKILQLHGKKFARKLRT